MAKFLRNSPILPILALFSLPSVMPLPALAIAPGIPQARYCQEYVADEFRVTLNDVEISSPQRYGSNRFKINWTMPHYRGKGSCIVSTDNKMVRFEVDRQPTDRPHHGGPDERRFSNLPGYGDVVVVRGQRTSGDRQYFILKPINTNRPYQWYARCGHNKDQVYDHRGKYVGYNPRLSVMFPFVCEISPLSGGTVQPR